MTLPSLVAFNLGVELGQLGIVLVILPLRYGLVHTTGVQIDEGGFPKKIDRLQLRSSGCEPICTRLVTTSAGRSMVINKRRLLLLASLCVTAACDSEPRTEVAGSAIRAGTSASAGSAETITLITGDRVLYSTGPGGPSAHVEPGPGRSQVGFATVRHRDHLLVIPHDVAGLIAARQLDRALFDITALVEAGYTDRRRDDIPLIVTGPSELLAHSAARDGLTVDRRMPALQAVTVRQRKVSGGAALANLASNAATKIWLDRVHRITLPIDRGLPPPGSSATAASALGRSVRSPLAPDAQAVAGSDPTGAGVTVAVLSTGIDAMHPDLAGKVIAAEDFTGDGEGTGDVFGLGTHDASVIAGTGVASDGAFRGVAPDARLLSARVCQVHTFDPFPFRLLVCPDSAVLAGIEWAVVEQHAKIVELIPGIDDTPGTDPLEASVEQLAADLGTLFISGAGDFAGFGDAVLAEPGNTDPALSVGAVDHDGQLAEFSSRGPRIDDSAIKPDLTALGVDAVGARASGVPLIGTEVGTAYQAVSTTEVAAARVAGAAALLAAQRR